MYVVVFLHTSGGAVWSIEDHRADHSESHQGEEGAMLLFTYVPLRLSFKL